MSWEKVLQQGQEIILATSFKNEEPHVITTFSCGIPDNKLLNALLNL